MAPADLLDLYLHGRHLHLDRDKVKLIGELEIGMEPIPHVMALDAAVHVSRCVLALWRVLNRARGRIAEDPTRARSSTRDNWVIIPEDPSA